MELSECFDFIRTVYGFITEYGLVRFDMVFVSVGTQFGKKKNLKYLKEIAVSTSVIIYMILTKKKKNDFWFNFV